jgi:hypothetical protein
MCATPITDTNTTTLLSGLADERIFRPLPSFTLDALPLTDQERQNATAFILSGDFHKDGTPEAQCVPRIAVCRPVPLAELGNLAAGSTIIYSEIFKFTEDQTPPTLCSHVGTVSLNDGKRGLLYTSVWVGNTDDELSHEYSEVFEVWQVQKFITLAASK